MKSIHFIALLVIAWPWVAFGQTRPSIAVTSDIEDGKKMLHAMVTLDGKPLENVTLQYYIQRTFGNLLLGEDTTLDDGSSAIAFPSDLPGAADGKLHTIVRIKTPDKYAKISSTAELPADVQPPAADNQFPRALWAPQAPLALLTAIFVILACVWLCYLFVAGQVLAIRMGGRK